MEQAIFISKLENLRYVTSKYTRLYFGNEFCQRLIPSSEDLKFTKDFVLRHKMDFTLVTPYVTNKGIEILRPILEYVIRNFSDIEIVINDWGLLEIIRKEFRCSNFVLGRLLTKQKRGPRILNLMGKVPNSMIQHFRESNVDNPTLSNFLINKGIKRIELDNLLQGISRVAPLLKGSLYIPFAYITTTRFCLVSSCEDRVNKPLRSIVPCNKACQRYTFKLEHKNMPIEIFLKGNTQFFKNEHLPDNLEQLSVDRLVCQPEIPL